MSTFVARHGLRRLLFLTVAALSVCLGVVAVTGQAARPGPKDKDIERFLGYWEGIDPLDGSPVRLSLSDIDGDGEMEHTLQEDFYTSCFNLGPTYSQGRGVVTGSATPGGPTVLNVLSELTCLSDGNARTSLGSGLQQYTLASRGNVLVLPPFGNAPGIVLHRIAE